jgi:hypothetical protein
MLQQHPPAENPDLVDRQIDFRKFLQDPRLPYRLFDRCAIRNFKFDNKLSIESGVCNLYFHYDKYRPYPIPIILNTPIACSSTIPTAIGEILRTMKYHKLKVLLPSRSSS